MTGSITHGSNRTSKANCGSLGELLPPAAFQELVGSGGPPVNEATGEEFLGYLVDLCGLQPGDAVLDIGCGSGRMALPFTGYLNREGRYARFDVAREAIAWCTQNIYPNVNSRVADLRSKKEKSNGNDTPSDVRLPYPDDFFDVVLLASVFTRMLASDVKHYMQEIVRVLKPGGRSLATFFLLNEESSALSKEEKGAIKLKHEMHGPRTVDVENPETAIRYPEAFVRDLYRECGLELQEPLRYGKWCGRANGMSWQDVVIAVKGASTHRLAQGVRMTETERPNRSSKHPPIPPSDQNTAFAQGTGGKPGATPAATPAPKASETPARMSPAAAKEYVASLYATILQRDPTPAELVHWASTATVMPPEQVYFAFVNSKEYRLRHHERAVPTMFPPGHCYSPVVDPSTIAKYMDQQYLQEPDDIKGIQFDEAAMVRFWKENAEFIKNTPFSEHDDGKNRYYYNDMYPYGDAIMLSTMIAHFKPKNVIEVGSGFSSACMLDTVDQLGLSDFTMTCIDPDADRLRSRLREEDHSRVDIIEGLVQDVPVSTFSTLKENDILFIDSTHVLKTASDVHYELFSILPSLNKGVLVHFHDIQYPFEYPRQWLFEDNRSWNETYALRAFLMFNSAFEVLFWNGLFAHRQRALIQETNPLFLNNPGGSIWLRTRPTGPARRGGRRR
ncbi:methyltransferase domain-containing protein [Mycobacterium conspicuum]|uniref:methyltransferase domain-containing protein n=1 Tax=Mycobacterium conspicuum TaxID=44010 RepID=UPI000A168E36|nr:methyltransferase domain-containing protein [Mycobacterium conspicuum]